VTPLNEERGREYWSYAVVLAATRLMKVVSHEGIHKHKMFGRNDDEAILYCHIETRRKLNTAGVPVIFNIYILIFLNVHFSTANSKHYRTRVDRRRTDE